MAFGSILGQTPPVPFTFTITLNSSAWSSNSQTISNANFITQGYSYIVNPDENGYIAWSESGIYANDIAVNGQMTFICETAPTQNITVKVLRMVAMDE